MPRSTKANPIFGSILGTPFDIATEASDGAGVPHCNLAYWLRGNECTELLAAAVVEVRYLLNARLSRWNRNDAASLFKSCVVLTRIAKCSGRVLFEESSPVQEGICKLVETGGFGGLTRPHFCVLRACSSFAGKSYPLALDEAFNSFERVLALHSLQTRISQERQQSFAHFGPSNLTHFFPSSFLFH
jgi:hypothetical protein